MARTSNARVQPIGDLETWLRRELTRARESALVQIRLFQFDLMSNALGDSVQEWDVADSPIPDQWFQNTAAEIESAADSDARVFAGDLTYAVCAYTFGAKTPKIRYMLPVIGGGQGGGDALSKGLGTERSQAAQMQSLVDKMAGRLISLATSLTQPLVDENKRLHERNLQLEQRADAILDLKEELKTQRLQRQLMRGKAERDAAMAKEFVDLAKKIAPIALADAPGAVGQVARDLMKGEDLIDQIAGELEASEDLDSVLDGIKMMPGLSDKTKQRLLQILHEKIKARQERQAPNQRANGAQH